MYSVEFYYSGDNPGGAAAKADTFASLLATETGFDIDASIHPCESGVVQHLGMGDVDIAAFSAFAYVKGHDTYGFEAELANIRFGRADYRGQLNVQASKGYTDVWGLRGTTIAFPSPGSWSGHFAPYVLISKTTGIAPEDFFREIVFSGGHSAVILDVYSGTVDVGGSFDDARSTISGTYTDVFEVVSVLAYTEYSPNEPWVFRTGLSPMVTQALVDGIVVVAGTDTGQNALEPFFVWIDGAAPIDDSDYDFTRSVVDAFGLEAQSCINFVPSILKSGQ
jgi:phosphonate transport system substrate-binding protein